MLWFFKFLIQVNLLKFIVTLLIGIELCVDARKKRVMTYASRKLKTSETNYLIHDLELVIVATPLGV